jgi:hypothetical protein
MLPAMMHCLVSMERGHKVNNTWLEVLTAALAVLAAKSATRMVLSCILKVQRK